MTCALHQKPPSSKDFIFAALLWTHHPEICLFPVMSKAPQQNVDTRNLSSMGAFSPLRFCSMNHTGMEYVLPLVKTNISRDVSVTKPKIVAAFGRCSSENIIIIQNLWLIPQFIMYVCCIHDFNWVIFRFQTNFQACTAKSKTNPSDTTQLIVRTHGEHHLWSVELHKSCGIGFNIVYIYINIYTNAILHTC